MSDIILSLGNVVLYQKDIDLLKPGSWLNDSCIQFGFELLKRRYEEIDVFFVDPGVVFMLSVLREKEILGEENREIREKIQERRLVLFPVVGGADVDKGGGVHWSLLVYEKATKKFFNLDSNRSFNYVQVEALVDKLSTFIGKPRIENIKTPQQENSFDCGIFLLCFADILLEKYQEKKSVEIALTDGSFGVKVEKIVETKRKSLLKQVEKLISS
eukprot:snap_masked-scaffold_5-processed-gene-11.11-mRNA-1 protein AED:0.34 eAED:1.00 QI:0/-1/0/1/-1/1/1/0/214